MSDLHQQVVAAKFKTMQLYYDNEDVRYIIN